MPRFRCPRCGEVVDNGSMPLGAMEDRGVLMAWGVACITFGFLAISGVALLQYYIEGKKTHVTAEQVAEIQSRIRQDALPEPVEENFCLLLGAQHQIIEGLGEILSALIQIMYFLAIIPVPTGFYMVYLARRWRRDSAQVSLPTPPSS